MGMPGQVKEFEISKNNRIYYDTFLNKFEPKSRVNYKVSVGGFLSELGTNDFAKVVPARINKYVAKQRPGAQKTAMSHLRSMMMYVVKNDVNGAVGKVNKEMLIWLIGSRAAKMCRQEQMTMFAEAGSKNT